jgi:DNA-binding XRE family transcriptional regulator
MDALPFYFSTRGAKKPKDSAYPAELRPVGDHIRARRLDFGLFQKDGAKEIGVTTDTITNWKNGDSTATLKSWPKVTRFLGYEFVWENMR